MKFKTPRITAFYCPIDRCVYHRVHHWGPKGYSSKVFNSMDGSGPVFWLKKKDGVKDA